MTKNSEEPTINKECWVKSALRSSKMHGIWGILFLLIILIFPVEARGQTPEKAPSLSYEIVDGKMELSPVEISTGTFTGEIMLINNQREVVRVRYLENEAGDCPTHEVCHPSLPVANCWISGEECGCICSAESEQMEGPQFTGYGTGDLEKTEKILQPDK